MKKILTQEEANSVNGGNCLCDCSCTNRPFNVGPADSLTECANVCTHIYGDGVNIRCKTATDSGSI